VNAPLLDLPGPRGLPILGSSATFARDPLGFLVRMQREHGDRVFYVLGGHPIIQLSHPDDIDAVLLGAARKVKKDAAYDALHPLLGRGMVTAEGETWARHRKLAAPSFTRKHLEVYAAAMLGCTRDLVATLRDGEQRDLHRDFMRLTQRIVLNTLFGTDLPLDGDRVANAIETVMDQFASDALSLWRLVPPWVPTPGRTRSRRAIAELDEMLARCIAARRAAGPGVDLLSRLLEARDDEGRGLDDTGLRDEVITLFVAGHETTALALLYTVCLLAGHPDALTRLHAEVDAAPPDARELPFTTAVIKESMRLYPPVWAVGREATEEIELGELRVPRGTQLLCPQWVVHRDARWFESPGRFLPERWLGGDLEKQLPRMAYFPFGGGPRVCIGNYFAMLELVLALSTLARAATFTPVRPFPPRLLPSVTIRPDGPVEARVTLR
jgi:cytochrome P450